MSKQHHLKNGDVVFVTGGSGFLGKQLITDLVAQGYKVRALVRSNKTKLVVERLGAVAVEGNLFEAENLEKGMEGCAAVFHCAAKVELWGNWQDFYATNVEGTCNVLEAAHKSRVKRFLHVSTEAVLLDGTPLHGINESRLIPQQHIGMYSRSKAMAEKVVINANSDEMETVVVRPRFIWGKGDSTLLPQIVSAFKKGRWIWFGKGSVISTCHVRNISHGAILAVKFGRPGNVYYLTDGEIVSFRHFISELVKTQDVSPTALTLPVWVAILASKLFESAWGVFRLRGSPPITRAIVELFFKSVTVSDRKARAEFGYAPVVTIAEGIRELRCEG